MANRHVEVKLCTGTTCHVLGAADLQAAVKRLADQMGQRMSISGTSCMDHCRNGAFGKAPFVEVDGELLSRPTSEELIEAVTARVREARDEE